jgi:hypothetical protein
MQAVESPGEDWLMTLAGGYKNSVLAEQDRWHWLRRSALELHAYALFSHMLWREFQVPPSPILSELIGPLLADAH